MSYEALHGLRIFTNAQKMSFAIRIFVISALG